MEIRSETKSLPRNRKCGNCRYFEPAPLWRKGWCRNPRLYDRRANHLVDATTIDCEQVFRARIYWEPLAAAPVPEGSDEGAAERPRQAAFSADSGGRSPKTPTDNALRPSGGKPVIVRREVAPDARFIRKPSKVRKWLRDNIPYYDKVDGPIHSVNYRVIIPWLLVIILLVFILLNLSSSKNKDKNLQATSTPSSTTALTNGDQSTAPSVSITSGIVTTVAGTPNSKTPAPTATLSSAIPTAIPPSPTPATPGVTQAKVINAPKGVNLRASTCSDDKNPQCKILGSIPLGATVNVTSFQQTVNGVQWWPVSYNGLQGYVASDYLQPITKT